MKILEFDELESTNSRAAELARSLDAPTMIVATKQTAGRGQRGNSWESEPGKNLTFSVLARLKDFPAKRQFAISEATALAIADALGDFGIDARVKWPNDIYVGDKKICGILIEHSLMGSTLQHSIIGAGINVNQREFVSSAPNPVSMMQILGSETSLLEIRSKVASRLEAALSRIADESGRLKVHREFLRRLWRGEGFHPFVDKATGARFEARIAEIQPDGPLILQLPDGSMKSYLFKQVEFIL